MLALPAALGFLCGFFHCRIPNMLQALACRGINRPSGWQPAAEPAKRHVLMIAQGLCNCKGMTLWAWRIKLPKEFGCINPLRPAVPAEKLARSLPIFRFPLALPNVCRRVNFILRHPPRHFVAFVTHSAALANLASVSFNARTFLSGAYATNPDSTHPLCSRHLQS